MRVANPAPAARGSLAGVPRFVFRVLVLCKVRSGPGESPRSGRIEECTRAEEPHMIV
jgi:hypothetical protein